MHEFIAIRIKCSAMKNFLSKLVNLTSNYLYPVINIKMHTVMSTKSKVFSYDGEHAYKYPIWM